MKTQLWNKFLITALLLVASRGYVLAQDKSGDLAIVVNTACSLENVSTGELAKILKAETAKSPDGVKYIIAVRETGSPEREGALKSIYQMSDAEYEKFFLQATFAGTVQAAPKQLTSGAAVRRFVASDKGAISYLCASEADATVKILKVDGKSPGDPGYPIKMK
jgi:hypothetical protein